MTVALTGLILIIFLLAIAHQPESDNTIAYSLPAANLVERGRVYMPQLGSQYDLDQFWLLNSPLMALGQVPFFWALGTSRLADLTGVYCCTVFSFAVFFILLKKIWRSAVSGWLIICTVFGLLGHRFVFAEMFNQRYLILAFGVMALTFFPFEQNSGRKWRTWQWALAGCLSLVHPSNLPAQVLWLIQAVQSARSEQDEVLGFKALLKTNWLQLACFMTGVLLTLLWYGRPEELMTQFLPHAFYGQKGGNFRASGNFGGMFGVPISWQFAIPSQVTSLLVVVMAWCVSFNSLYRRNSVDSGVKIASFTLAVVSLLDMAKGFGYIIFYLVGLAPGILAEMPSGRWQKRCLILLTCLGGIHLAIALKFDTNAVYTGNTPETISFIQQHTKPGDKIVIGPPFVLASAFNQLSDGRVIDYVVPEPYWLSGFSSERFRNEIRKNTWIYAGSEKWYEKQMGHHISQDTPTPIFENGLIERFTFHGIPVVVVRSPKPVSR